MIRLWWKRLVCVAKDHKMVAVICWSPEEMCMRIACGRCGKELGHIDVPQKVGARNESLH